MNGKTAELIESIVLGYRERLADIGYKGYLGFELCHQLPIAAGRLVSIDFADRTPAGSAIYARDDCGGEE